MSRPQNRLGYSGRVRQDGHADVAPGGETLFLQMGGIQSLTTGVDPLDNNLCLSQLEETYHMSRPKSQRPTVISWNVGPLGYMMSLHRMSQTLKIGVPVVLFQEIHIPSNAQRSEQGGMGYLQPVEVMTEVILQYIHKGLLHDDVIRDIILLEFQQTNED